MVVWPVFGRLLLIAVVTGAIYGYSLNQWAGYFVDAERHGKRAVAVGFAKAISVILPMGSLLTPWCIIWQTAGSAARNDYVGRNDGGYRLSLI